MFFPELGDTSVMLRLYSDRSGDLVKVDLPGDTERREGDTERDGEDLGRAGEVSSSVSEVTVRLNSGRSSSSSASTAFLFKFLKCNEV